MDPHRDPFNRRASTAQNGRGAQPSNGYNPGPVPIPLLLSNPAYPSTSQANQMDPFTAIRIRASILAAMNPINLNNKPSPQKEFLRSMINPDLPMGTPPPGFTLPQSKEEPPRGPIVYQGTFRYADDPAIRDLKDQNGVLIRDKPNGSFPDYKPSPPPRKRPTIPLWQAFDKEIIYLGRAEKYDIREAFFSKKDLIMKFIGDVTELTETANVEYKLRVKAIEKYLKSRIAAHHALCGWNKGENLLSKEEADFLGDNERHIYRILHRIFAPEMTFFTNFEYKAFGHFVEEEIRRLKFTRIRHRVEDVIGDFEKLTIVEGDAEAGQEIQQAVTANLAGEVPPEKVQEIFEIEEGIRPEQMGAVERFEDTVPAPPTVEHDDLVATMKMLTLEEKNKLVNLEQLYKKVVDELTAWGIYGKPGLSAPVEPSPPAEVQLQDYDDMYPETAEEGKEEELEAPSAVLEKAPLSPQEVISMPVQNMQKPTMGAEDGELELEPTLRSCLKKEKGFFFSDADIFGFSSNAKRHEYSKNYQLLQRFKKTVRISGTPRVRIFCHNWPHRLIQERYEKEKKEEKRRGKDKEEEEEPTEEEGWKEEEKKEGWEEEWERNTEEDKKCYNDENKEEELSEEDERELKPGVLYFPTDYGDDGPPFEFLSSHYKWTAAFECRYKEYRLHHQPEFRATAHSNLRDYTRQAIKCPGSRLILDSRLRKTPLRFNDELVKFHVIPGHPGKRDRNPVSLPIKLLGPYIKDQYRKLVRYGSFWQPVRRTSLRTMGSAYNHCYGVMVLTDSILEEAEPRFLLNTGLFAFPPPLGMSEANELLEQIKVKEFGVRDIVVIWGLDSLLGSKSIVDTVGEVITFYEGVKRIMETKLAVFRKQGYLRLKMPRIWLTTIPVSPTIRAGSNMFNITIRQLAEVRNIPVIDWAGEFAKKCGSINERNAEDQLEVLYDLLKRTIGVIPYRTYEQRMNDFDRGAEYTNAWEFEQEQMRKIRAIRMKKKMETQELEKKRLEEQKTEREKLKAQEGGKKRLESQKGQKKAGRKKLAAQQVAQKKLEAEKAQQKKSTEPGKPRIRL